MKGQLERFRSLNWKNWACMVLAFWILTGIFQPLLIGRKSLWSLKASDGHTIDRAEKSILPLILYNPAEPYLDQRYRSPNWISKPILGTDHLGRDVWKLLLMGSSNALKLGLMATLVALILGVVLGISAGWFYQVGLSVNFWQGLLGVLLLLLWFIVTWIVLAEGIESSWPAWWIYTGLTALCLAITRLLDSYIPVKKSWNIPVDTIVLKLIELMLALPGLIVVMIVASVFGSMNIWQMGLLIGLVRWPIIAQYTRAETIKLKQTAFISLAEQRYQSLLSLWLREIVPHLYASLGGILAFGVASAILAEATITFIGLGLSYDNPSWGGLIQSAIRMPSAWWLYVFPGLLMVLILLSLNKIGEQLIEKGLYKGKLIRWL